ncbi:MAG: hypothetical protein AAF747_03650, partial [Planctomycetota bacterium]
MIPFSRLAALSLCAGFAANGQFLQRPAACTGCIFSVDLTARQQDDGRAFIRAAMFAALPDWQKQRVAAGLAERGELPPTLPSLDDIAFGEPRPDQMQPMSDEEIAEIWPKLGKFLSREAFDRLPVPTQRIIAGVAAKVIAGEPVQALPCFAPGTDPEVIAAFSSLVYGGVDPNEPFERFRPITRWSSTATNPSTGTVGNPITITYSFPDDGVRVSETSSGGTASNNNLNAFLDSIYGNR